MLSNFLGLLDQGKKRALQLWKKTISGDEKGSDDEEEVWILFFMQDKKAKFAKIFCKSTSLTYSIRDDVSAVVEKNRIAQTGTVEAMDSGALKAYRIKKGLANKYLLRKYCEASVGKGYKQLSIKQHLSICISCLYEPDTGKFTNGSFIYWACCAGGQMTKVFPKNPWGYTANVLYETCKKSDMYFVEDDGFIKLLPIYV